MRRHLFYCCTPFQIMMAAAFKMTILKGEQVDIIVSDLINGSEALFDNISKTCFFTKAMYLKNYKFDYVHKSRKEEIKKILNRRALFNCLLPDLGKYDCFYVADSLQSINVIYEILKRKNKDLSLYYYEEGPVAVLCDQGNHFKRKEEYFGKKRELINALLGCQYVDGSFDAAYSSVYDKMEPNYFEWRALPVISATELKEYVEILNTFWGYGHDDTLKHKIVFLEESFYVDNRGNRDFEIVRDLLDNAHGRDVLVKLHPRTRDNRFKELGIDVYKNVSVPWELVALNRDLDDTILVCVGSGAILYPKLYWNIEQKSIALLNCKEYQFPYIKNNEYYETFGKVCEDKKLALLPKNKEEFFEQLGELINGTI